MKLGKTEKKSAVYGGEGDGELCASVEVYPVTSLLMFTEVVH